MNRYRSGAALLAAALLALLLSGCATAPYPPPASALSATPVAGSVLRASALDRALEDRILALDPERVSDEDVRGTLAKGPTPRVVGLHGGIYPVHLLMESFAQFLVGMGYPEERIRDAGDGALSHSPYENSEREAGLIAWYYEREGVRALLVGHSQGGIQAMMILHDLAGSFGSALRPFNPLTGEFEERTTILDPLTGRERPVVGLSVAYASVVGTGGWSLALPIHWGVLSRIRTVPDTVDEFTGYRIEYDLFAWDAPGFEDLKTFHANGKANVRNVTLPAGYSHVFVPGTAHLAETPEMRAWINAFDPDDEARRAPLPEGNALNVLWAADVWHSIKRHWALEAQRFVRARRAAPGPP
jgi:pimeloyl-ACP methyl ester carboxylesterase